ncbi:unnamed protein product [Knipowitschia caucasica]
MELLTCALVTAVLSSTYAIPASVRLDEGEHIGDADLDSEPDLELVWRELSMRSHTSQSSSESQSSEETSREETPGLDTPPTELPPSSSASPTSLPVAMTTGLSGTDMPTVYTTVPGPCPTTGCVTVDIPTAEGDNRGDA